MKQEIEDYQLLLIRQCKRNIPNVNIMRRLYAKSRALSFNYCTQEYVTHALLESIEKFNLRGSKLSEFVWDLCPNKNDWLGIPSKPFKDTLLDKCVSIIRLSHPAEDFPRYISPAWFRNLK